MVKKKEKKVKIKKERKKAPEKTTTPAVWDPFDIIDVMDKYFMEGPWIPFWRRQSHRPYSLVNMPWREHWLEQDTKQTTVNMIDTGKEFKISAEMPGVSKNDIDVSLTENKISICGETKTEIDEEKEGWVRRERSYSTLCRTMAFPEEVNPEKAEATLKDGILEIKVAKKTPTKGRNIPVR